MTRSPAVQTQPDNYKWEAFWTVALALFVILMDFSISFLALSVISGDFSVTLRSVTRFAIASLLTISAIMLLLGRVTDIIGRKGFHITAAPAESAAGADALTTGPSAAATAGAD